MVCIYKTRDTKRGPFYYEITESDKDSRGNLIDIVDIEFREDKLDEAIKTFMELCERPKKTSQRKMIKKMGGHAIFVNQIATNRDLG